MFAMSMAPEALLKEIAELEEQGVPERFGHREARKAGRDPGPGVQLTDDPAQNCVAHRRL